MSEIRASTYEVVEFGLKLVIILHDGDDLFLGLNNAPQRPEHARSRAPGPDLVLESLHFLFAHVAALAQLLLSVQGVHPERQVGAVKAFSFGRGGIGLVMGQRVRVSRVVVVCAPLVKVVGNVVASGIGGGVLKVDDDKLLLARSTFDLLYGGEPLLARGHDPGAGYCHTACRCLLSAA